MFLLFVRAKAISYDHCFREKGSNYWTMEKDVPVFQPHAPTGAKERESYCRRQ